MDNNTIPAQTNASIGNAYLRLHLAVLIAGGTGLFGRLLSIGELPLVCYRVILAAIILAAVMWQKRQLHSISWNTLWRIMGCGVLLSVHWVFYYGSIKAANISIGAVCFALVGFMTAVIEPLLHRHRPNLIEVSLGIFSVVGIMLIFGLDPRYRLGIGLGIISSLIYTFFSVFSKQTQQDTGVSSSTMLLYEMVGGTIVLTLALPLYAKVFPNVGIMPVGNDWWWLIIFSSVFTVVPFLLQLQALRHISAFTVNLTYNLEPVYTVLLAMLFFGEANQLSPSFWLGVALIIISVALQAVLMYHKTKTLN